MEVLTTVMSDGAVSGNAKLATDTAEKIFASKAAVDCMVDAAEALTEPQLTAATAGSLMKAELSCVEPVGASAGIALDGSVGVVVTILSSLVAQLGGYVIGLVRAVTGDTDSWSIAYQQPHPLLSCPESAMRNAVDSSGQRPFSTADDTPGSYYYDVLVVHVCSLYSVVEVDHSSGSNSEYALLRYDSGDDGWHIIGTGAMRRIDTPMDVPAVEANSITPSDLAAAEAYLGREYVLPNGRRLFPS